MRNIIANLKVIVITFVLLGLVLIFVNVYPKFESYSKYNKAISTFNSGDYINAETQFNALGDYKDSTDMVNESKYNQAKKFVENKKYDKAINIYTELGEYKDSSSQIVEVKYKNAEQLYNDGKFLESKTILDEISKHKDIKDLLDRIEVMESYQGTWKMVDKNYLSMVIDRFFIYSISDINNKIDILYYKNATLDEFINQYPINNKEELVYTYYSGEKNIYKKINNSTEVPAQTPNAQNPRIGMTANDVEISTWGKPNKINKTTNKYGVHEQWIYSGNRYIYFEDGIVTSIQEW